MKKIIAMFIFMIITSNLFALNHCLLWDSATNGDEIDSGFCVRHTYDDRFIIGCKDDAGYVTAKYSSNGNLIWIAEYNDPFSLTNFQGEIEVDEAGNIYLTLTSSESGEEIAAVKYSPYGEKLWVRRSEDDPKDYSESNREELHFPLNQTDTFPYQTGWPVIENMGAFSTGQSMVGADFDPNNETNELALCMYQKIWAWNHNATNLGGWPVDGGYNHRGASIIVQDMMGRIAFSTNENSGTANVLFHTSSPTPGWPQAIGGNMPRGAAQADMNGNTLFDVAAGIGGPADAAYIWNPDGSPHTGWPVYLGYNVTGIAIGDVNNDGVLELVCSSTTLCNKHFWVISASGNVLSGWHPDGAFITASENNPVLADLDNDDDLEIIWSGAGDVFAWHHDGTEYWGRIVLGGCDLSPIAVGDLYGDGYLKMVVSNSSNVYLINHDGTFAGGNWPISIPGVTWVWSSCEPSGPVIGDIDNDSEQEIVLNAGGLQWALVAFEPNGRRVRGFPTIEPPNYTPSCSPFIIDLDRDGDIEICSYAEHYAGGDYHFRAVVYDLPTLYDSKLILLCQVL